MSDQNTRFQSLEIPAVINTGKDDFISDFYEELLSRSKIYKRGVGYFTSGWIAANARGMAAFAENGGTARWITSPHLDEFDWEALQHGARARDDPRLHSILEQSVSELSESLESDTRNALAWLIADGVLEIKIAVPTGKLSGDFHDKWGIFASEAGDRVAFHGSQNDSQTGFSNYESFDIFCDWEGSRERERVNSHDDRFDDLWKNRAPNVDVFSIPDEIKEDLLMLRSSSRPYSLPSATDHNIRLRGYQTDAIDSWENNNYRGMLEMATGTGKTYTAIGGMDRLFSDIDTSLLVVIAVPYTHLAKQWADSLEDWGYSDSKYIYGSANRHWKEDLSSITADFKIGVRENTILLTTHATFGSDYFKSQIDGLDTETLLIADEVHGLGSSHRREALLQSYDYRLGLSATPTRYFDDTGTSALKEFFEGIVFEFGIGEAIPKYLTEYDYFPHVVELTDEELAGYATLSKKLASEMNRENPDQDKIERLLIKRSRIIKSADNKLPELISIIRDLKQRGEEDHLLVYTNPKQIDEVQELLNNQGLIQHRFTNEEDDEERQRLLEGFAEGRWDALVAMKCLDEGVDVPSTQRAILMSNSQNPKQFIQRRGRVLRRAEELGKDHAEIHDMIVVPSLNPGADIVDSEKNILKKELKRFEEFAADARNPAEARNRIQRIRTEYQI